MNWEQIKKYHLNPPQSGIDLRSTEVQRKYEEYKLYMKDMGIDIADSLLEKIFPDDQPYVIIPNDFPYHLQDNIQHMVLWIHPTFTYSLNEIDEIVETYSQQVDAKAHVYYRNLPHVKTVNGIDHLQLFLLF